MFYVDSVHASPSLSRPDPSAKEIMDRKSLQSAFVLIACALAGLIFSQECLAQDSDLAEVKPDRPDLSWTGAQVVAQIAFSDLLILDYRQTMDIQNHHKHCDLKFCYQMAESNQLLGSHPSDGKIQAYFFSAQVLELLAAHYLPGYRDLIIDSGVIVEAYSVGHNKSLGLSMHFAIK